MSCECPIHDHGLCFVSGREAAEKVKKPERTPKMKKSVPGQSGLYVADKKSKKHTIRSVLTLFPAVSGLVVSFSVLIGITCWSRWVLDHLM